MTTAVAAPTLRHVVGTEGAGEQPDIVSGAGDVGTLLREAPGAGDPVYRAGDGRQGPDVSRIVFGIGRFLISAGLLMLLFVAYQLWGTGIREARAQSDLRGDFAELTSDTPEPVDLDDAQLAESLSPTAVSEVDRAETEDPAGIAEGALGSTDIVNTGDLVWDPDLSDFGPPPPPPADGEAVARLRIPKVGLDKVVVEGVSTGALKKGPGHYPGTPLPGQTGNASIAGHRTTYGAPFYNFDELDENDLIYVTTQQGSFQYRVVETLVVSPGDIWVLDPTTDNRLTLTTCNPRFSARERLIVIAELIGDAAPATLDAEAETVSELPAEEGTPAEGTPAEGTPAEGTDVSVPVETTTVTATTQPVEPSPASIDAGLSGDRAAALPTILWGLVCVAIWVTIRVAAHKWQRIPAYLLGLPVYLVALFFFFEDFSRLLPANI
jgi:sortase A